MGCQSSSGYKNQGSRWQRCMENYELRILDAAEVDTSDLQRTYTWIEMDGSRFGVRTHIYGEQDTSKRTLVLVHGYLSNSVGWLYMIKPLAERYRLVLFDHGSWGLNSKLSECSGLASPKAAESWMREWIVKVIDALPLPETFLLAGHSIGGWLASQYASQYPHRVESLFLMSPAGTEAFDQKTWDPYKMKDPYDLTSPLKRRQVDKILRMYDQKTHPLSDLHKVPRCLLRRYLKKFMDSSLRDDLYPEELRTAAFDYFCKMLEKPSVIDIVELMPFKFESYSLHPLQATDRLGNPEIQFPIAMAFGDRDKYGTEGADEIIKGNKHYKTGHSQLFKVKDCSHAMHLDQPYETTRLMVGFFEGTITGRFELVPRDMLEFPTEKPPKPT